MSGLHASVNTHISEKFEDLMTHEYSSNNTYFLEKVGDHKDRVKNLHFIYAAVIKAVGMMEPVLLNTDYQTGLDNKADKGTSILIRDLLRKINSGQCDEAFKEKDFFQGVEGESAQLELLGDIQHSFYNISRIMDCVACDKCRLNGKVQVRGLATILKVLFLPDSRKIEIMKTFSNQEIVSTIQLLHKLSESLNILEKNRIEEIKKENIMWASKQVVSFFVASSATIILLMLMGFSSKQPE